MLFQAIFYIMMILKISHNAHDPSKTKSQLVTGMDAASRRCINFTWNGFFNWRLFSAVPGIRNVLLRTLLLFLKVNCSVRKKHSRLLNYHARLLAFTCTNPSAPSPTISTRCSILPLYTRTSSPLPYVFAALRPESQATEHTSSYIPTPIGAQPSWQSPTPKHNSSIFRSSAGSRVHLSATSRLKFGGK